MPTEQNSENPQKWSTDQLRAWLEKEYTINEQFYNTLPQDSLGALVTMRNLVAIEALYVITIGITNLFPHQINAIKQWLPYVEPENEQAVELSKELIHELEEMAK